MMILILIRLETEKHGDEACKMYLLWLAKEGFEDPTEGENGDPPATSATKVKGAMDALDFAGLADHVDWTKLELASVYDVAYACAFHSVDEMESCAVHVCSLCSCKHERCCRLVCG